MFQLPPNSPIHMFPVKVVHGLCCGIETPKYGVREGRGWSHVLPADYGFIHGYIGADGDEIDCYIGSNPDSARVWVVDQNQLHNTSKFDEHKVMLGYDSKEEALNDYLAGHTDGKKIFRGITFMLMGEFKKWLMNGDLTKPLSD